MVGALNERLGERVSLGEAESSVLVDKERLKAPFEMFLVEMFSFTHFMCRCSGGTEITPTNCVLIIQVGRRDTLLLLQKVR